MKFFLSRFITIFKKKKFKKVIFRDKVLYAGVFTLFNHKGEVISLMVLLENNKNIYVIPKKKVVVELKFSGVLKFDLKEEDLEEFSRFSENDLKGLYHLDKEWMLERDEYQNHRAKEIIKETNCASGSDKIQSLHFSKDLSVITGVTVLTGFANMQKEVKPELVFEEKKEEINEKETTSFKWVLDPLWNKFNAL